jgi:hypothetical protein
MYSKKLIANLWLLVTLVGCGIHTVSVTTVRDSGLDLSSSKSIIIGTIAGVHGNAFRTQLTLFMTTGGRFKIVNDPRIEVLMQRPLNRSLSQELRRTSGATILISGIVDVKHEEGNYRGTDAGKTKQVYTLATTATFHYQIIDLDSARFLDAGDLKKTNYYWDDTPPSLKDIEKDLERDLAQEFIRTISHSGEMMVLNFLREESISEVDRGIELCRNGHWSDAITTLLNTISNNPGSTEIHKVHFDLGVVYQYLGQYTDAWQQLNQAYSLKNEDLYRAQLQSCTEAERAYTERQQRCRPLPD